MNCRKVNSLLSAYIDSELTGTEQLQIRDHLRRCESCSAEYESLLYTKQMISRAALKVPRPSLEEEILQRIAVEDRRSPSPLRVRGWWSLMDEPARAQARTVALFAVFCALAMVYVLQPFRRAPDPSTVAARFHDLPAPASLEGPSPGYFHYHDRMQAGFPMGSSPAPSADVYRTVGDR